MKQYPKYKDSKIPWIGDIPEHWEKMRTKNMFTRMNRPVESNDEVITCFRDGQVTLRKNRRTEGFTESFKEIGYQGIRPGDLVVHQMDAFAGAIGVSDSKGKGTPVYICLQPKGDYSNYYYAYLLREMARKGYIKSLYRGIRERSSDFRYETMGKLFLPIPPFPEQQAIVKYIDEQVQKIDRYIAAKEAEIEKLGTLKQSIISQAVTKGLDPNAPPMKDSGIDWMGNIPENWEIHSIKQHFCIQKRIAGKEGYNVFSITQKGLKIKDISQNDGQMAANYSGYQFVYPGDFAMNHMDLITGGVGLSTAFGVTSPDYRVFELFDHSNCFSEYYLRIFQVCYWRRIFYRYGRGAASIGRWRLPAKAFLNFHIPVPPKEEQENITKYINIQIEKVDFSIANIRRQIEKLKTYKQRLISDAVTGKIDVRERLG